MTFTCLGSPLPPGPAPSAPPSRPLVLGPPQGQQPPARRPPATGRTKQRSSQETSPRICATQMMEKKGMGTKENRSREGAGNTEEYFLKRILIRKAIIVLGGKTKRKKKKGLGRSMQFVPPEIKSSFSPTPSGKVTWRAPRNTFRKTNVKGRDRGPPFSPVPSAALPGLAQQQRAKRMDRRTGSHPWNQPGNIQSRCSRAIRIFLSLENILETPMKETCFPCQLPGLRREFCPPGSGRTWGHLKGQPS